MKSKDGVLRGVATMHPGLGEEDQGAGQSAAPGCQAIGVGADTPAAPHPTHHQGATVGNLCPQVRTPCPSSLWP